jgi:uncharacterized protein (DUF305 family)
MVRSRVAIVGVVVAVCAALAGLALALAAVLNGSGSPSPGPSGSASTEPVTADDFCYVEAMIYYRVEAVDLANAVLDKSGISAETEAFAQEVVDTQSAELEKLRPWYVSWKDARPLERPDEGPCKGHGTTHAQMPGLPTPSQWNDLIAADGANAEKMFLELLITQNDAMIDFVNLVLEGDPHSRVQASAEQVLAKAEDDDTRLQALLAGLP